MRTLSKDPHGEGFREVEVVQEYEIVSTKTTDELVLEELRKHPQMSFQLSKSLQMPSSTIDGCLSRLFNAGLITKKEIVIRLDGRRRNVIEYRLLKK